MMDEKRQALVELVFEIAARVGGSAPRITDELLPIQGPLTMKAATAEGLDTCLREGVERFVKRVIRTAPSETAQTEFDPDILPYAKKLKSHAYYVEAREEHVSVADLIKDPHMLDDARKYMRRKGEECIEEADRLDQLYFALTEPVSA